MANRKSAIAKKQTVFVFGALRSGTTVFRLMLNAHPGLSNPGEMDFLFDYLTPDDSDPSGWVCDREGLGRDRIFQAHGLHLPAELSGRDLFDDMVDQLHTQHNGTLVLTVHRHADRMIHLFPDARIVHLVRDPRDVARSSIGMGWAATLYYGVNHWIQTELSWDRAMAGQSDARILELKYENLFRDTDASLRKVCDLYDVAFTKEMLNYHENSTYEPPDASLVEQWRHKCKSSEIALLEGKAENLMRARGYELAGQPHIPGILQGMALKAQQKLFLWKFGIGRFGLRLFLGEKLTRWMGLGQQNRRIQQEMKKIKRQYLK